MSRIVTLGEIMGRLAAPGHRRFQQAMPGTLEVTFAGAEASVAVGIARLGGEAAFVSALPDHDLGDACLCSPAVSDGMLFVRTQRYLFGLHRKGARE